jgi:hypothetical protein
LIEARFAANWSVGVRVPYWTAPLIGSPEPLIGGSLYPDNQVPLLRIATLTRSWADADEDGVDLLAWDPTLMDRAIHGWARAARRDGSEPVEVDGQAWGLVLDRRRTTPLPQLMNGKFFYN